MCKKKQKKKRGRTQLCYLKTFSSCAKILVFQSLRCGRDLHAHHEDSEGQHHDVRREAAAGQRCKCQPAQRGRGHSGESAARPSLVMGRFASIDTAYLRFARLSAPHSLRQRLQGSDLGAAGARLGPPGCRRQFLDPVASRRQIRTGNFLFLANQRRMFDWKPSCCISVIMRALSTGGRCASGGGLSR